MPMAYRIMTVCTGNICRSPMAEVVLRDRVERAHLGDVVAVDSTGVSGEEAGSGIDPRARRALAARGYPVPEHVARRVRAAQLFERDLVLAATSAHARQLRALVAAAGPDRAGGCAQICLVRAFDPTVGDPVSGRDDLDLAGGRDDLDLDDPWYGTSRDFERCLDQIEAAADGVVGHVARLLGTPPGISTSRPIIFGAD